MPSAPLAGKGNPGHLLLPLIAVRRTLINPQNRYCMSSPPNPPESREAPPVLSMDVGSINSIVRALYEVVSFPPGGEPDWDRLRSLFYPRAVVIPPRPAEGATEILDVEKFISNSRAYVEQTNLRAKGFREVELDRHVDVFGNLAHVLSMYEARHTVADPAPVQRGANSIQLLNERGRWWVVSIFWDIECEATALPGW
jgi:hypothetical protein